MASNLNDCIEMTQDCIQKNNDIHAYLGEIKLWVDNFQATMAELLGSDASAVELSVTTSQHVDSVVGLFTATAVELEFLSEHLQAMQ